MNFNSTMSMIFPTSFNKTNEINQSKSLGWIMPGNSVFLDVMWTRLYTVLYSFMFVFCLSFTAILHVLLVRLLRQRLFKHLTRVLLLINLVDLGAVLFGLPYHWLKLVFDVDIRTLHVWLCRAHVFIVNDFMDLSIALRLLLCISQVSAVFPALRTNAFARALSSCRCRFSIGIFIAMAVVLLKSALESLFQDIVEFKNPEICVCLNRNGKTMLFFTMISSGFILLTYPAICVCNCAFLVKIKITSRNRFNRRSIPAAEEVATCPPIPLLEFREQYTQSALNQTSKLCSMPKDNSDVKQQPSENHLIPSQSNGLKPPPTLSPPSILPVPEIIEPLNADSELKENQNSGVRQILPLTHKRISKIKSLRWT